MRHTKIVATVGPASQAPDVLEALIAAGVDVFRLNFSHGTHESHAEVYRAVRETSRRAGRHVAIMQDLSGPKIRTGPIAGGAPLRLREGEELRIGAGRPAGRRAGASSRPTPSCVRSARPGDRLLLDDGRIELRVIDTARRRADDRRRDRRAARRAQGHQCARRRAAGVRGDREGRGRSAVRALRSASISSR